MDSKDLSVQLFTGSICPLFLWLLSGMIQPVLQPIMALKSTIFKAEIQVSDMTRSYYGDHSLTIARHPSENDERMMVRILAFALHAHERLMFGESIGNGEEPSLWQKDLTGTIELWIDVGQPDEKRIRKACGRAGQVVVIAYGGHGVDVWLNQIRNSLDRTKNLTILNLPGIYRVTSCILTFIAFYAIVSPSYPAHFAENIPALCIT
jgi:uncharacterized protein YaeQ